MRKLEQDSGICRNFGGLVMCWTQGLARSKLLAANSRRHIFMP